MEVVCCTTRVRLISLALSSSDYEITSPGGMFLNFELEYSLHLGSKFNENPPLLPNPLIV